MKIVLAFIIKGKHKRKREFIIPRKNKNRIGRVICRSLCYEITLQEVDNIIKILFRRGQKLAIKICLFY
jgi:predicted ATPase with chaperone activity